MPPSNSTRRELVWSLRIAALVIVGLGVSGTVHGAIAQLSQHEWQLRPGWIVATAALYVLGLMPMAWFWHRILAALRHPTPWLAALRAYFLGHIGKYVPGKAMTVILRVAAVRKWIPSMRLALVSMALETLTMMSAGAFLAFILSLAVLRLDAHIWLGSLGMAIVTGAPTLPPVARWLARLGVGGRKHDAEVEPEALDAAEMAVKLRGIDFRLLAAGWLAAVVYWVMLGLSLSATLRAVGVDRLGWIANLPILITAASFAVVAGFLSMLPAGLLVRDAVLMQLLAPVCGEVNALVAAVLARLVWLVSELVVCGILYLAAKSRG